MDIPIIKLYKKDTWLERVDKAIEAYFKAMVYGECFLVEYDEE